ncbi:MAG TPA: hypothetical protein PLS90_08100 [Candidatus Sumerlaeota bacterium]|nr:hypothetical protein [Candidatus Sumerlaeota bacterium]
MHDSPGRSAALRPGRGRLPAGSRPWVGPVLLLLLVTLLHERSLPWRGVVPFDERILHLGNGLFSWRCLRAGTLPLWNPYAFCGLPHLATHHAAALYPPVYLFFAALPPFFAFAWMQVFHRFLMGLGTFALLRFGWRLRHGPALAGGVCFMLSGYHIAHEPHQPMIWAAAWAPWMLWCSRETLRGRRWAGPLLAVLLALQIAAGYMQLTVMTLLVLGAEGVWLARPRRGRRFRLGPPVRLAFALAVGIGLMAVQLWMTRDLLPMTFRGTPHFEGFISHRFDLPRLIAIFFPMVFGAGVTSSFFDEPYFGVWDFPEMIVSLPAPAWLGIGLLLLGPILVKPGRLAPLRRTVRDGVRFWFVFALFCLLLLPAEVSPLPRLLYHLPVLNLFRIQTRWMALGSLALALLAAAGFDRLLGAVADGRRLRLAPPLILGATALLAAYPAAGLWLMLTLRWGQPEIDWPWFVTEWFRLSNPAIWLPLAFGAGALALLPLAQLARRRGGALMLGWIALVVVEQMILARHMIFRFDMTQAEATPPRNEVVAALREWHGADPADVRVLPVTGDDIRQTVETLPLFFPQINGVYSLGGNWPLISLDYSLLLRMANIGTLEDPEGLLARPELLAPFNARYLLFGYRFEGDIYRPYTAGMAPPALLERVFAGDYPWLVPRLTTAKGATIVENTRALPRAWMVERLEPVAGPREVIDRAWREPPDLDPANVALVELMGEQRLGPTDALARGSVAITERRADRLRLAVESPGGPGFVVLSETWYPWWWTRVNGELTEVYRVDGVLRGFYVPEGRSEVYMRYLPPAFKQGLAVSLLAGAVWAGWVATALILSRRRKAGP